MDRYWIYIDKKIQGPFEVQELLAVNGFSDTSQVCMVGEDTWQPARQFPAIHLQLAPTTLKITEIPTPLPTPTPRQMPNAMRVSGSGDYVSPDFQFEIQHRRPNLRLRKSTRQPLPARTLRVVPLPQPSNPHVSRVLPLLAVLLSLTGGLWAYNVRPGLPAPVAKWLHSHITIPRPAAPPLHPWRPAKRHPQPPPHIPAPLSHPKHSKTVPHRRHPKFTHTSRKPWFDLRDKSAHHHRA